MTGATEMPNLKMPSPELSAMEVAKPPYDCNKEQAERKQITSTFQEFNVKNHKRFGGWKVG